MKFQTNTKPFVDALALGIINANVSSFHRKSCIVQISADTTTLRINVESYRICTEIKLKGSGEGEPARIFVDSLLIKQLASTFDSSTITLEFTPNGLVLQSGKSKFTLPKEVDSDEIELTPPGILTDTSTELSLDKEDWKFVKDFQMYAIATSFSYPVYTRVWAGEDGDVMVSDFNAGLFTHSKKSKLGSTCLLQESIVNLFNSLPEGTKIAKMDTHYIIKLTGDSYEYVTEFMPEYEGVDGMGKYSSELFLEMMKHENRPASIINVAAVSKLLGQATLLTTSSEDTLKWIVSNNTLKLLDNSIDGNLTIEGDDSIEYSLEFKLDKLKQVISNYSSETISVAPVYTDDQVTGVTIWDNDLTTMFAGVE